MSVPVMKPASSDVIVCSAGLRKTASGTSISSAHHRHLPPSESQPEGPKASATAAAVQVDRAGAAAPAAALARGAEDPVEDRIDLFEVVIEIELLFELAVRKRGLHFFILLEQVEQNRLAHKRNLVEIDYQITRLSREIGRQRELLANNLVSQSTIDQLQDELNYYRNRREVTLESQVTDARMQEQQLQQLRDAGEQLQAGLGFARKNLDDLNVRAPIAGKVSGFNIEVGQSIARGGRLGQIDDPDGYKLNARIDEYYLGRVDLELPAIAEHNGRDLELRVAKIYPQVNEGNFEVDMVFEEQPDGLRRGQTLQTRLTLGDNTDAVLIPNGSFYQETGGKWVFVVAPDGGEAIKRNVRLGRRNSEFIEVLEGLEPGERVITSPYTSFVGMDRLSLNDD